MVEKVPGGFAEIRARNCVVQLFEDCYPSPMEVVFREPYHVLAMQQQRRHAFSDGRFCVSGSETEFEPIGRLLLLPADTLLEVRAEGGMTSAVRCCFTREAFAEATGLDELIQPEAMAACLDIHSARITNTLAQLAAEVRSPGLASPLLVQALGASIMIELARYIDELPPRADIRRGGLSRRAYRQIVEYVDGQNASATLDDLGRLTGLSRRHLCRAFKETTGRTVHDFVEHRRFERAASLLAETDLLIKDIAFKLGFSRTSSFSVAFRRAAGESPQTYRDRQRPVSAASGRVASWTTERITHNA